MQLGAHGVGQVGGGRLLEQLLVAALHGAVAVAEDGDGAVVVGEDLHLDVARAGDVTLEEHLAPPERGGRLAARGGQGAGQLVGARDDPHPAAPAAVRGLDQQREADPRGGVPGPPASTASSVPSSTGTAHSRASARARTLSPMAATTSAGGPTNTSPASVTARANPASSASRP